MIVTRSPRSRREPGPGSCPITVPSGSSAFLVSTSTMKPSRSSSDCANSCGRPTTSGSVTRFAPLEMKRVTWDWQSTSAPPGGSLRITRPAATSRELCSRVATSRSAASSRLRAWFRVSPRRAGTLTLIPRLTVSVASDPSSASEPARGSCSITVLSGSQLSTVFTETSNPRRSRVERASASGCPITAGTVACSPRVSAHAAAPAAISAISPRTAARRLVIQPPRSVPSSEVVGGCSVAPRSPPRRPLPHRRRPRRRRPRRRRCRRARRPPGRPRRRRGRG